MICRKNHLSFDRVSSHMRNMLATKSATLIWGNGYNIETNNPKMNDVIKKFDYDNNLVNFFYSVERKLSKEGRVFICLYADNAKNLYITTDLSNYTYGIGKIFVTPHLAVIYSRIKYDNINFIVKSTYDSIKCVNEFYGDDSIMLVMDKQIEISRELRIPRVWYHNLGFVPVIELVNKPIIDTSNYLKTTDWYDAVMFENLFYDTYINLIKEININHTRIGIDQANQELIEQFSTNINKDSTEYLNLDDIIISTDVGGKVSIVNGQGDFAKYTNLMNDIMDFYFKFANSSRFSDGGGAQKTSAESNLTMNSTLEGIQSKIVNRIKQYTKLFDVVFKYYGIDKPDEYRFRIDANFAENKASVIDGVVKQVNLGTMSIVDGIMEINKINKIDADKKWEQIKKFNEENDVMINSVFNGDENVGGDDGGRPIDE